MTTKPDRARSHSAAPWRLLWPFTFGVAVVLGLVLGLALGAITDALPYYVVKETLMGAVGGIFAPLFLLLLRGMYNAWRGATRASRPVSYLLHYLAGGLAGLVMIAVTLALPARIPPGAWLVLYPLGAAGLFPLIGLVADYAQEQREEHERTKDIFGKYVSESIAQRILAAHPSIPLAGEKRQATVLISDIRGFTRMIKDLGAEEVVNTLNDYFARMIDIIFQYDGTVNKFIGDAIVVLYGVPLATGDEPRRAIQTAHAMQQAVATMNAGRAPRGQPPLHIGIAIDAGEVVVGNIGSPRRMEYTAIGTPVNTAYHLASLAPADTIYVTENVYRLVPNLDTRAGERIELKGDTGEINVYVLNAAGETQPAILSNLEPPIAALRPEAHV